MSAFSIQIPFPVFQGRDGQPLKNGYIWIGEPNLNPQTNPVVAYYDAAMTIVAPQPLRTLNGYVSRAGTPAQIYVAAFNFSILVQDSTGSMVYNFSEGAVISPADSGANSNITSLSGLTTALSILQGGTGATTAAAAPFARKGANSDITSLSGLTTPLSIAQGGTGSTAGVSSSKIQSISASWASNAIMISTSVLSLDFRSTTLTSGTVTTVSGTPANLVIAATDSFAAVTAAGTQRIAILAINNAGTIELAASNLSGGLSLDETGVITTFTAATTATQIKSTTARTSVAYRVIGFVDVPFTTAVGWGAIVEVQGTGGQALAAMSSLGYGQTWQNMLGSRESGTTYYNTTGKPIEVGVQGGCATSDSYGAVVNGISVVGGTAFAAEQRGITFVVPIGASYVVTYSGVIDPGISTVSTWAELR
jgi:hypothetical protein